MKILSIGAIYLISVTSISAASWQLKQCSDFAPEIIGVGEKLDAIIDQAIDLTLSQGVDIKYVNDISMSAMIIDDELTKIVNSIHQLCAAVAEAE
ncbi:hypothetical protein GCM10011345_33060 [Gemmobacter megaterium]|uniref:hypothetical protein n=1 Tax=Gemmobacter megaterium TaxID=1086013 RepID=UPI00097075F6|nr:hypothetical protein [Gemmobacter megaterium]GGE24477.1 hypothetical protein GCM10011345_33060 [Gemmobacter megaterium]